jgi:magnesium transporter
MIRTLLYNPTKGILTAGSEELLLRWQQEPETIIWADFSEEQPVQEKQILEKNFGIHPLAIQDAQRERHPPKLEAFNDYTFLLLKELSPDSNAFDFATTQLAMFVGERFLITRHAAASPSIDALFGQVAGDAALFSEGQGALAMRLCRALIDRYLAVLLALEPRLEELERELMEHPSDAILAELLGYKTELKRFRRVFLYHEQIFRELKSRPFPALGTDLAHQIIDVYEQQERAGSLAGLYYELASDMADGYISVASHHLNQIMKILTVVMAIFVPLSFLAGIYGMNFENMPELHSRSGYFILLTVMGAIALLLLVLFRKKRWL